MAEDLMEAQSAAILVQQEILNNGEELRVTLKDSTQGKITTHTPTHLYVSTSVRLPPSVSTCVYLRSAGGVL